MENVKKQIIKLYEEGKSEEEISNILLSTECSVDVFGIKYPKKCCEDGLYCERCHVKCIETFLDNCYKEVK